MKKYKLPMLISGGQTGVDRAALDFAIANGIHCGGWCPGGRRSEDGKIPERYPLIEASSELYQQRTRLNVRDSDATLILMDTAKESRGTKLTIKYAARLLRPYMVVDLAAAEVEQISLWLQQKAPAVLNVAGPRASESFRAESLTWQLLSQLLQAAPIMPDYWPPRRPQTRKLPGLKKI